MAQATRVQEGVDQIRTAVRQVDRQFRKLQRQVTSRRKQIEKEWSTRRRALEKRAQRELGRFQRELRKQPLLRRAESLRAGAASRLQSGVAGLLEALPIATKSEVERIDRKVASLNRKLRELEKASGVSDAA